MPLATSQDEQSQTNRDEANRDETPSSAGSVKDVAGEVAFRPVHLHSPIKDGAEHHFEPTDVKLDVAKFKIINRILKTRPFQFMMILPNQIIFWIVIIGGIFAATQDGTRNFGTVITWYVWFCLVFVMMVGVGRAWCNMCPFGGFAEWLQRHTFWKRTQKALGLGWKMPPRWAKYGLLFSLVTFVGLTWIEEFFNIAGPGPAHDTGFMVLGIISSAVLVFLLFERRTFCRYICPLSGLIGSVGAIGSVAGFRTRNRQTCIDCPTKDCMRGSEHGFGCPWYTWPGSADSNMMCGLCSECYKACPYDNVGLFVQKPLTSVVAPRKRRVDIAWVVVFLLGLVVYQQVNALGWYTTLDNWLNAKTGIPHYPNPIDYLGIIAIIGFGVAAVVWLFSKALPLRTYPGSSDNNLPKKQLASSQLSPGPGAVQNTMAMQAGVVKKSINFNSLFVPLMYGIIPVMGADYLARQLPKLWKHSPRLLPSITKPFGFNSPGYNVHIIGSFTGIIATQVGVVALGTLASLYAIWRINKRDVAVHTTRPVLLKLLSFSMVLIIGAAIAWIYVLMNAAS
ncbi:MAG: 4Fe-4S binding protein [Actinobacteria bacterium]|nr:4Fe-4S binding protein [Actinomycetota bacterium]MCL6104631.1 4Fe-4S binding protein [Actinomycetota bacterium]